jgi:malate dehydrogenase (oxaloacetate-decarboxylating)(NADP+)
VRYADIFRRPRGIFVSINDLGRVDQIIANWPHDDVKVIVFTDGERILGLGDLGANGIGIPIGKLMLYTACAGIAPSECLPVQIDVGTNNQELRDAPLYIGLKQERTRGDAYDALLEEFITAAQNRWPNALLQFEDFANANAFPLLQKYRDRACCFNDDIQGTASVALSGILSSLRLTGKRLDQQRLLFLGAGEAGLGIAELLASALVEEGIPKQSARECCWFVDSKGLVVKGRDNLNSHKLPFAHDHAFVPDFQSAVETLNPTGIIGVSGQQGSFTRAIIEKMAEGNDRPLIFALSNPTSKAECTAEDAYRFSNGKAVFASGSPFEPVTLGDKTFVSGQGNNAYIFPGIGLGVLASKSSRVTDEMFLAASKSLADAVSDEDLAIGRVYPSFTRIREVSAAIAVAVAEVAFASGLAHVERPDDIPAHVRSLMYEPVYKSYI